MLMRDPFTCWPTVADFAADLRLPYQTVSSWRRRGIPPRHAAAIVAAARRRGFALTLEDVLAASSASREAAE